MFRYHRHLLADAVRTNAYRDALKATVRPGDVVVDIGTGTGVLAFFACDAGARHVYAIEQQHTADAAAMLARQLGYADRVTVLHRRSDAVDLPEPADVLVTDTVGPLVFNEGWLGTVIDARRRLLVPGARLIPSRIECWAAPVEIPELYAEQVDWWSTPRYGLDLSLIRLFAANATYSARIDPAALLAQPETAMTLVAAEVDDTVQEGRVAFRASRGGVLHAFAVGFRSTLADGIVLTNGWDAGAIWEQGLLMLEHPALVDKGMPIALALATGAGRALHWRGTVGESGFAQTTLLARPPCIAEGTSL